MSQSGLNMARGFTTGFRLFNEYKANERAEEMHDHRMGLVDADQSKKSIEFSQKQKEWDRKEQDWQRQDDGRLVQAFQEGLKSGHVDPEIAEEFGNRFDVDWSNYVNSEFGDALSVLEETVAGKRRMKDPEFKSAFELVFNKEIKKGIGEKVGDKTIVDKTLNGVYPSKDGKGLSIDLNVKEQSPDGWSVRRAPVTEGRSAQDEFVKTIDLEQALKKLKGHRLVYNGIQNSPELKSLVNQLAARTGVKTNTTYQPSNASKKYNELLKTGMPEEQARQAAYGIKDTSVVVNNQLIDRKTGKIIGDYRDDQSAGKGNGSKVPASIQTAEWMVSKGLAENLDEAWNRISESRTDPSKFVMDYMKQEMGRQNAQLIGPEDEGYKSPEALQREAIEALNQIRSQTRGSEKQGSNGDKGKMEAQSKEIRRNPDAEAKLIGMLNLATPEQKKKIKQQFVEALGYLPEGLI